MWFILSLFSAIWGAISSLIIKKLLGFLDMRLTLFCSILFVLPFTFLIILTTTGFPKLNSLFFLVIIIAALIDVVAFIASITALKISPLSTISPIASFSPIFTTILAAFALREFPTTLKLVGIIIVVIGAYLLNIKHIRSGFSEPIKKLVSHKGVQLYFLANFLWAITPIFQKIALENTFPKTPLMASFANGILVVLFLIPFVIPKVKTSLAKVKNYIWVFLIIGLFGSLSQYAAYTAFSLANLGYVTSIFKLQSIFMIILAAMFLKEKDIREKLLGAVVMLIGAVLVAI